ncbi:MAG: hypothetical protein ABSC08_08540 [Bryobacteraceae bacterium]
MPVTAQQRLVRALVVVAALSLALAVAFAAGTDTRVFKVLVAPGEGVSSSAFSRVTGLVATLDKQPYTIRSAEPLRPGEGRTVIVVDFGQTSPTNHACLLAEALNAMEQIHESPAPLLLAVGDSRFVYKVDLGPGRGYDILASEDLKALTSECETGQSPNVHRPRTEEMLAMIHDSFVVTPRFLRSLGNRFTAQDAPVRVFWLAELFFLFDKWKPRGRFATLNGAPTWDIASLDEAALTFFPIVLGIREGGHLRFPLRIYAEQAAGVLAKSTGGFVSIATGGIGDTLLRAFERTKAGVVLTLEGPVTANGRGEAIAETLMIKARGTRPPATWRRSFIVEPAGRVQPLPPDQAPPLALLMMPAKGLTLQYGCQAPGLPAGERSAALTLPPEVVAAPSDQVDVYLDYPNEKGLQKQRLTLARTQDVTRSLCLPLIHARDGMAFRVVVIDRASGWVGAKDGVLAATKGGQ